MMELLTALLLVLLNGVLHSGMWQLVVPVAAPAGSSNVGTICTQSKSPRMLLYSVLPVSAVAGQPCRCACGAGMCAEQQMP